MDNKFPGKDITNEDLISKFPLAAKKNQNHISKNAFLLYFNSWVHIYPGCKLKRYYFNLFGDKWLQ